MKHNLLLFCLFLSACGTDDLCEGSDWKTFQNICVFTNGFEIDEKKLSHTIDVTEGVISGRHPKQYNEGKLNDSYDSARISFVGELGDKIDGYCEYEHGPFVNDTYKIVSEYKETKSGCGWHYVWIVPHEMMHMYLINAENNDNHKRDWHIHTDFTDEENANSMQYEIYKILACDLCGSCN